LVRGGIKRRKIDDASSQKRDNIGIGKPKFLLEEKGGGGRKKENFGAILGGCGEYWTGYRAGGDNKQGVGSRVKKWGAHRLEGGERLQERNGEDARPLEKWEFLFIGPPSNKKKKRGRKDIGGQNFKKKKMQYKEGNQTLLQQ